mmetsp:Transcript_121030/g.302014  ORF Transcript_121030/g.302014 Transcript_121030/m.302014 type:complete len:276 (-) Transcript_121030:619-1446(-)
MKQMEGGTCAARAPALAGAAAACSNAGSASSSAPSSVFSSLSASSPAGGCLNSFSSASASVPFTTRKMTSWSSVTLDLFEPSGRLSAFGSGSRLFSGLNSPRNPTNDNSSVFTLGKRFSNELGCSHLSSQVEEAPRNQAETCDTSVDKQQAPSTASCSTDQRTVLVSASPQSPPLHAGASPASKAAESTSSPATQRTAHLSRASARSLRSRSSSFLSSPDIWSNIFLRFLFCFWHCIFHSRSTSCCICRAAVLPGSTSNMSFSVTKHSSNLCMAR